MKSPLLLSNVHLTKSSNAATTANRQSFDTAAFAIVAAIARIILLVWLPGPATVLCVRQFHGS